MKPQSAWCVCGYPVDEESGVHPDLLQIRPCSGRGCKLPPEGLRVTHHWSSCPAASSQPVCPLGLRALLRWDEPSCESHLEVSESETERAHCCWKCNWQVGGDLISVLSGRGYIILQGSGGTEDLYRDLKNYLCYRMIHYCVQSLTKNDSSLL